MTVVKLEIKLFVLLLCQRFSISLFLYFFTYFSMGQKASGRCLIRHQDILTQRQVFYKSKQCLTKALIKTSWKPKTSQKCLQDTAKTTFKGIFKICKRQLFSKSNQCLSKPYIIHISGTCLGRISGCLAIDFCEI